jgi:adenylate cyclase
MGVICRQKAENSKHGAKSEAEAERCFQQALRIARRQKAKSLELRAVMDLGHVWAKQGRGKRAYRLLSQGYHWFSEGFNTVDLQEATAMLDRLQR